MFLELSHLSSPSSTALSQPTASGFRNLFSFGDLSAFPPATHSQSHTLFLLLLSSDCGLCLTKTNTFSDHCLPYRTPSPRQCAAPFPAVSQGTDQGSPGLHGVIRHHKPWSVPSFIPLITFLSSGPALTTLLRKLGSAIAVFPSGFLFLPHRLSSPHLDLRTRVLPSPTPPSPSSAFLFPLALFLWL